jgi:hypothetical protein
MASQAAVGFLHMCVCVCVCVRRACLFQTFTHLTDFQETKLNIMNFWDNPLLVATPLETKINLAFLCKLWTLHSHRAEAFVTKLLNYFRSRLENVRLCFLMVIHVWGYVWNSQRSAWREVTAPEVMPVMLPTQHAVLRHDETLHQQSATIPLGYFVNRNCNCQFFPSHDMPGSSHKIQKWQ